MTHAFVAFRRLCGQYLEQQRWISIHGWLGHEGVTESGT